MRTNYFCHTLFITIFGNSLSRQLIKERETPMVTTQKESSLKRIIDNGTIPFSHHWMCA